MTTGISVATSTSPISFIFKTSDELCSPVFTSILCLIFVIIAGVDVAPLTKR